MATLTETLTLPGSNTPEGVTVTVVLAGENGQALPAGYATVGGETIVGRHVTGPDATTGVWSVDLERNDQITPTGTAWKVVLSGAGVSSSPRYVELDADGSHDIADVLVDAPASVGSATYAALEARIAALEATAITIG